MIVRNEEKFLANCLRSVESCVDEMVIVDTGSTDRTMEIAKSFGAQVYQHPWEKDFSKHRNQSIGRAKGEWILWMDADEELESGAAKTIRSAIITNESDSLMLTMVCYFGNRSRESWNNAIKLFKNGQGIHFEGAVHNQVIGFQHTRFCPVKIYHYGYDVDQKTVMRKFERTGKLLQKAISEDPANFRHHHDLAVSYMSVQRFRQAVDEGLAAIKLYQQHGDKDPNILWTYFVVASSYFNLGLMVEAQAVAEEALRMNNEHLDSYFVLASIYAAQKERIEFQKAYRNITRLIRKYRKNPELLAGLVVNKIAEKWRLGLDYGTLLLSEGKKREATAWLRRAVKQAPDKWLALKLASLACRKNNDLCLAEHFLESAIKSGMNPYGARFEKALNDKAAGLYSPYRVAIEDLLSIKDLLSPELKFSLATEALRLGKYQEAETLLLDSLKDSYANAQHFSALALACKYQGKVEEAIRWNLRVLEHDDRDLNAMKNLGNLYYQRKEWSDSKKYYRKALIYDPNGSDVLFRCSLLALMDQDLTGCIAYCDQLLKVLMMPCDMEIANIEDLSIVYRFIGDGFLERGEKALHAEAVQFGRSIQAHPAAAARNTQHKKITRFQG
jgi:tetratricopeptide (TPR) repeat protein